MVNPATGVETEYEEVWEAPRGGNEGLGEVVVLRTVGGGGEGEERGMVVRVGGYVQGVLRTGERVDVGRWKRRGVGWEVVARMGGGWDEVVGVVTGREKGVGGLRVGGRVRAGGREWEVLELEGGVDGLMP